MLSVQITGDMEQVVRSMAAERGVDAQSCVQALLAERLQQTARPARSPRNGAELLSYWHAEGVAGAWADREDIGDSVEYARVLRRRAEARMRE